MKDPKAILKQYWGYDSFRPMQLEIIQSALDKQDTLALLPTGGGKSICFQIPSLCQEGICIVVSPLIALMKDQVYNLKKRNINAIAIYSGMHYRAIDRAFDNCAYGNVKFLYLSPERLLTELAQERIKKMKVNLIAVDEAHCVSQWGYDFRPPYLQIPELRELLPDVPILALTATATPEVVKDIQEKLEFKKGKLFQQSFMRSNLAYVVLEEENKNPKLLNIVQKVAGSGVVYVRNRRKTKEIALFLQKNGVKADFYHAGLSAQKRSDKQDAWINNQIRIMVSTNAFGMGIDKANVRTVVHMDLPDSLEAYFQEAGRAGRDGKKAYAILLYNSDDRSKLEYGYKMAFPEIKFIKRVYQALGSYFQLAVGSGAGESFDFEIVEFTKTYQLHLLKTYSALKILEQSGWLSLSESVYSPATIKVNANKEDLYNYQLQHPKLSTLIKTVLRTYQGIFGNYVNIDESRIANFLKIPRSALQQAFQKMHKDGIISYQAHKDKPQLTLIEERVDAVNLNIDAALYKFRKNRHLERIKKALTYAEDDFCRSQQLLAYFGEENEACGVCDICLNRKSDQLTTTEFDRYKNKIIQLLQREQLPIKEIVDSFAPKRKVKVLKVIEFLIDEQFIELKADKLMLRE